MIHPSLTLGSADAAVGVGLFAEAFIPKGTITWALDPLDLIFDPPVEEALDARSRAVLLRYGWRDASGRRILCWDHGRYMNHGCRANSLSPGLAFEIAVADIRPGEEVLCDYGALNLEEPFDCLCAAPECRGRILPEDFERQAPVWDTAIRAAFAQIEAVTQPLAAYLDDATRQAVALGLADPARIPSVLAHRYPPGSS